MRIHCIFISLLVGSPLSVVDAVSDISLTQGVELARRGQVLEAAAVFGKHCQKKHPDVAMDESKSIAWACSNLALALTNLGKWPQAYAALRSAYENGASENLIARNRELLLFWVRKHFFRSAEGFSSDGAERALARVADQISLEEEGGSNDLQANSLKISWRSFLDHPLVVAWNHFPQVAQLLRRLGLRREAREAFRAAAFFQPERDAFLSNLGAALLESGDVPDAFAALEAGRVLKGAALPEIEANLAVVRRAAGGTDSAFAALRARAPHIMELLRRRLPHETLASEDLVCQGAADTCEATPGVRAQRSSTFVCNEECKWFAQSLDRSENNPSALDNDVALSAGAFQEASHWLFAPDEWYLWDGLVLGYVQQPPKVASMAAAAECLPDIPVIYVHPPLLVAFAAWIETMFQRHYILITAGSDLPVSTSRFMLDDPFLIHWFSTQVDINHSKLSPIPRGVPSARLPTLGHGVSELQAGTWGERSGLLLASFERQAHPVHQRWWNMLCGRGDLGKNIFATCVDLDRTHDGLTSIYKSMASHRFVAVPAGLGSDPPEIWEALYFGAIPVIESSMLVDTRLYEGLPVLIIEQIEYLTADKLEQRYGELAARFENDVPDALRGVPGVAWLPAFRLTRLQPMSWQADIGRKREAEVSKFSKQSSTAGLSSTRKMSSAALPRRCWGY